MSYWYVLPPSQNVRRLSLVKNQHILSLAKFIRKKYKYSQYQININRFTRKSSFSKCSFDIVDINIFLYKLGQT
jgi:hypothetical protein